jgi:linoleate 10R-lipoxygenase
MLTKLLFRALPQHYNAGSIYAHFPMMVPHRMREFMLDKDPSMVAAYNWTRPRTASAITTVDSFDAVKTVLTDSRAFGTAYEAPAASLTDGYGFYLGSSDVTKIERDRAMVRYATGTLCIANLTAVLRRSSALFSILGQFLGTRSFTTRRPGNSS